MLDSFKRQLAECREDLRNREAELERAVQRQGEEERMAGAMERREKSKLQKEMEVLERNYAESEQQRKREMAEREEEYEKLQRKHRVVVEERGLYLQKLQEMEKERGELRDRMEQKADE